MMTFVLEAGRIRQPLHALGLPPAMEDAVQMRDRGASIRR